MADEHTPENEVNAGAEAAAGGEQAAPQFQIQKLYVKDVSFEVPNAPQVFQESGQSDIKLNMAQRVSDLGEDMYEVVLTVTATASLQEEQVAYLAEVAQAGIFHISGINEQALHAAVNTLCPSTLFPYARAVISNLVIDGGFPPLTIQPVNWDVLYGQRLQQAQNEAQGEAGSEGTA